VPLANEFYTSEREVVHTGPATPSREDFAGFASPSSNTTYCPNQFFDVVLPHFSRGVVRLVGYILYRTFGWSNRDGTPMREQHQVSYRELIEQAGVSRGALRQAIQDAIKANLLQCVRPGKAARSGQPGAPTKLELKWDDGQYNMDPQSFRGFQEGPGHRTYVPNQFFNQLLPAQPLSVLKVVGAVMRFSIGFEARRGFRRQQATLSYSAIQRYTRIVSRQDMASALKHALASNFIERVEVGRFDREAGRESVAATYRLRWADNPDASHEQSKIRTGADQTLSVSSPGSVLGRRSKIRTGGGSATVPVKQSKIRTGTEITVEKNHCKQQQAAAAIQDGERQAKLRCLREAGFDSATCDRLASHPLDRIQRQIGWMECRTVTRNKLGMLRKAIEEDWPKPRGDVDQLRPDLSPVARFARHYYAGLANNRSNAVAHPSAEDLLASEPVLQALQPLSSDTAVEAWGLKFGEYVARHLPRDSGPVGLATATRRFGDAFLVFEQGKRERRLIQLHTDQDIALATQLKQEYLSYLRSEEARLREQETSRYEEFLQGRDKRRTTLLRLAGGDGRSPLLTSFDSETGRLNDFQAFFSDQVPGLEAWGARTHADGQP